MIKIHLYSDIFRILLKQLVKLQSNHALQAQEYEINSRRNHLSARISRWKENIRIAMPVIYLKQEVTPGCNRKEVEADEAPEDLYSSTLAEGTPIYLPSDLNYLSLS